MKIIKKNVNSYKKFSQISLKMVKQKKIVLWKYPSNFIKYQWGKVMGHFISKNGKGLKKIYENPGNFMIWSVIQQLLFWPVSYEIMS